MTQDLPLELLQLGPGIDSELLDEQITRRANGRERVHLPAGAIESERMLGAETLAVGLGRDQPLQLGHEHVVAAERERGVVEKLDRPQATFRQLWRFRLVHGLSREVSERFAAPEVERAAKILVRVGCTSRGESSRRRLDEPLEASEIELLRLELQPVARPMPLDAFRPDELAQPMHVHLQRRHRRSRRLVAPQHIDQAISWHDRVRVQQQEGEQSALLRRSQGERSVVSDGRDRSQNAEFDCPPTPLLKWTPSGS